MFKILYYSLLSVISLAVLIKSADILLDSVKDLAKRLGVSDKVVALTLISFGTSLPEFIVALLSAIKGQGGIVLGDVLGSNIANASLGIGLATLIFPVTLARSTIWKEIPLYTAVALIFIFLSMDGIINVWDALTILVVFAFFVQYIIEEIIDGKYKVRVGVESSYASKQQASLAKISLFFIPSLLGLFLSGKVLVYSITALSRLLSIGSYILSSIIVAVGTSLPEIAVSLYATLKRESEILVGDIMGSNLFNLGFVLPVAAILSPVKVNSNAIFTAFLTILATAFMFISAFIGEKGRITRREGILLLVVYIIFLYSLIANVQI